MGSIRPDCFLLRSPQHSPYIHLTTVFTLYPSKTINFQICPENMMQSIRCSENVHFVIYYHAARRSNLSLVNQFALFYIGWKLMVSPRGKIIISFISLSVTIIFINNLLLTQALIYTWKLNISTR